MSDPATKLIERYLELLKKALLNELNVELEARLLALANGTLHGKPLDVQELVGIRNTPWPTHVRKVREEGWTIVMKQRQKDGTLVKRHDLRFLSENCHTMMGRKRLDHLHQCLDVVTRDNIPGDLIETGVWRGGGTIFMRGYLEAHGIETRVVWVADSFEGLPKPTLPQDRDSDFCKDRFPSLAISIEEVRELFDRYALLDNRVRFLKGWFKDTLPVAPIESLCILRLDGDLYESTMDALSALYDKVSPGGFVIIDDYKSVAPCEQAITDFRSMHGITAPLEMIDSAAAFFRKP